MSGARIGPRHLPLLLPLVVARHLGCRAVQLATVRIGDFVVWTSAGYGSAAICGSGRYGGTGHEWRSRRRSAEQRCPSVDNISVQQAENGDSRIT